MRAAWADWIADEVPAREVGVEGNCGFKGSGGGARSGSELSHLVLLSLRQRPGMIHSLCAAPPLRKSILGGGGQEQDDNGTQTYIGTRARLESNEPEFECVECVECLDRGRSP